MPQGLTEEQHVAELQRASHTLTRLEAITPAKFEGQYEAGITKLRGLVHAYGDLISDTASAKLRLRNIEKALELVAREERWIRCACPKLTIFWKSR